jgi:hypothetical protein
MKLLSHYLLLLFLSMACTASAQTACEQMVEQLRQFTAMGDQRMGDKLHASKEDEQYIETLYTSTLQQLNLLGSHQTDKDLLNEYHFCILSLTTGMADLYSMADENAQKLYGLLDPVKGMVLELDNNIMKHHNNITCTYSDGRQAEYTFEDYQTTSLNYWLVLMNNCLKLHKTEEAAALFADFKTFDFWADYNRNYAIASMLVRYQYNSALYDTTLFNAAAYALTTYFRKSGYDTTWLTITQLRGILSLPQLADSNIPGRANQYFQLYEEVRHYHNLETSDTIFNAPTQQRMLLQALNALGANEMFGSFIDWMEYNNDPAIDDLIALNDPRFVQRIIAVGERFVGERKLREPYFWQSMAKLYRAAGMNDKAADADKKFRKYK